MRGMQLRRLSLTPSQSAQTFVEMRKFLPGFIESQSTSALPNNVGQKVRGGDAAGRRETIRMERPFLHRPRNRPRLRPEQKQQTLIVRRAI